MKLRRSLTALGAFFAVGLAISACGSGVPGNSVADVAGNPVTTQAFNHWMYVAAKGNAQQSPGSPVIVPTDPPNFTKCIAQARKEIPQVAKESDKQLKSACGTLFTSLSSQVMDFLIRGYWYQADAARQHIHVTSAQVHKEFLSEKQAQYPTTSAFNQFLSQSGYTMADLLFRVRLNLIYQDLSKKYKPKPVTQAEVAAYYTAHKSQFGTPETRDLRIVLTKSASQASAAKSALQGGQSWTAVAKKYSTDPATKDKGGVMDNVSKGTTDPSLEKAAFAAPTNQLIGPVKGQFGYYVVQVTKITKGAQKSLAQEAATIKQTLTSQAQSSAQTKVDNTAKKNWLSKTKCRAAYAMADCSGYKAPKTTTSTTPTP